MRKKIYHLTLDPESTENVREWLKKTSGQSLSSYLTGILKELSNQINGQPTPLSKDPSKMTVPEFIEAMQYWVKASADDS